MSPGGLGQLVGIWSTQPVELRSCTHFSLTEVPALGWAPDTLNFINSADWILTKGKQDTECCEADVRALPKNPRVQSTLKSVTVVHATYSECVDKSH